ncbi:hypothetical protein Tco_0481358 [Tanacetum coccineum]
MHNIIMAAGSKCVHDAWTREIFQWHFAVFYDTLTLIDGEYLRKCIYDRSIFTYERTHCSSGSSREQFLPSNALEDVRAIHNMTAENKTLLSAEKGSLFFDSDCGMFSFSSTLQPDLVEICDGLSKQREEIDTVLISQAVVVLKHVSNRCFNDFRSERLSQSAYPLALLAGCSIHSSDYNIRHTKTSKIEGAPSLHAIFFHTDKWSTSPQCIEIAKPVTSSSESVSGKTTEDTTLRYNNDNQSGQFGNQRTMTVAGARETVGAGLPWQDSGCITEESSSTGKPLGKGTKNHDENDVFAMFDQNAADVLMEVLACYLIANLTLDTEENKTIL